MFKYTFRFKKPEHLLGDLQIYDQVICDNETKAWQILRDSYENEEIAADIVSVELFFT